VCIYTVNYSVLSGRSRDPSGMRDMEMKKITRKQFKIFTIMFHDRRSPVSYEYCFIALIREWPVSALNYNIFYLLLTYFPRNNSFVQRYVAKCASSK